MTLFEEFLKNSELFLNQLPEEQRKEIEKNMKNMLDKFDLSLKTFLFSLENENKK